MNRATCPSCGHENVAGARFCAHCGATLVTGDDAMQAEKRSRFRRAFAWTAIPIVALSLLSTAGAAAAAQPDHALPFYFLWFGTAGVCVVAILATVVFAVMRKGQIAFGMFAGIAVGILALALTCFANLATAQF